MSELWRNGKIRLIVAGACNLACFYCHNEGQEKHEALMDMELVDRVCALATSSDSPLREVTISGGEPLLHPKIEQIVARFAALGTPVTMVSNATLLNDKLIHGLRVAGLAKIRIGLDSLRAGKPRPSPGHLPSSASVPATVDLAVSAGLPVEINTVLTKYNAREIGDLAEFAVRRGLSIKFFEHVEVGNYGSADTSGTMRAKAHVPFEEFIRCLGVAGLAADFEASEDMGAANVVATIGRSTVRYCRYLCPPGLCWTTGTRIDPMRYVYSCMVNRGLDRLPVLPGHDQAAIAEASRRPCRSASARVEDISLVTGRRDGC